MESLRLIIVPLTIILFILECDACNNCGNQSINEKHSKLNMRMRSKEEGCGINSTGPKDDDRKTTKIIIQKISNESKLKNSDQDNPEKDIGSIIKSGEKINSEDSRRASDENLKTVQNEEAEAEEEREKTVDELENKAAEEDEAAELDREAEEKENQRHHEKIDQIHEEEEGKLNEDEATKTNIIAAEHRDENELHKEVGELKEEENELKSEANKLKNEEKKVEETKKKVEENEEKSKGEELSNVDSLEKGIDDLEPCGSDKSQFIAIRNIKRPSKEGLLKKQHALIPLGY